MLMQGVSVIEKKEKSIIVLPLQICLILSFSVPVLPPNLSALIPSPPSEFPTLLILLLSAYAALSPTLMPELMGHRVSKRHKSY